jgi:gliding motility-associated-like protein
VIEQLPDPSPLPDDTLICAVGWTALLEAAPGFDSYLWSTGDNTPTITVNAAGTYTVEYASTCDNYFDTVTIFEDPYFLESPDLGPDTIVCSIISEAIVLDANADLPNYLWNTGQTTPTIVVTEAGVYWVSSTTACLEHADTIVVNACSFINVPNAFSPNNDGINDWLTVLCSDCDAFISLSVFNRWGQLVFESNNPLNGWDGTFEGKEQPIGSYAFVLRYSDAGTEALKQGYITLVR